MPIVSIDRKSYSSAIQIGCHLQVCWFNRGSHVMIDSSSNADTAIISPLATSSTTPWTVLHLAQKCIDIFFSSDTAKWSFSSANQARKFQAAKLPSFCSSTERTFCMFYSRGHRVLEALFYQEPFWFLSSKSRRCFCFTCTA